MAIGTPLNLLQTYKVTIMNVDETKKLIAVMQAYVDGKEIEIKSQLDGRWFTLKDPVWDAGYRNYRVKPRKEKRVSYINTTQSMMSNCIGYPSRELADKYASSDRIGEAIEIEYEVEIP